MISNPHLLLQLCRSVMTRWANRKSSGTGSTDDAATQSSGHVHDEIGSADIGNSALVLRSTNGSAAELDARAY
jgi:hypothetical protein